MIAIGKSPGGSICAIKPFSRGLLPVLAFIGLSLWNCNVSNQAQDNLLSIKVDDSLSSYDTLRVDILHSNGQKYKDSVFYGKYVPDADHKIKDINLGENPPASYQILITGIRDGKRALVVSIQVTPAGAESPRILVREIPTDTTTLPVETLPLKVVLNTPTPLTLSTNSQVTAVMAEVQPPKADPTLLWFSSDTGIVQVDAAGNLYPRRIGEADVTIRSKRNQALSEILHVKVIAHVQVKGVTVTPDKLTLYAGGAPFKLSAQATPADAQVSVLFQSSNDSIAKVSADGTVTGLEAGSADIKVFPAGHSSLSLTCKVTVERDVPVLDVGGDRNARPDEILIFSIKVTQNHGDIAALKWDLDGNRVWDDSTNVPIASPKRAYDGKDSLVTVRFYVRDTEGNVKLDSLKVHIGQSLAAPVFTAATTSSPTRLTRPTWAWTGNPGSSGTFRYSLDRKPEVETKATSFTADSLPDGDHVFTIRESDANGAPSDSATRIIKVVTKGPIVAITAPLQGFLTNAANVGVTWTVKPLSGATVTNTNSENLLGKQGPIKIVREETDSFGNKGRDSVVVFRDTIPPAVPTFTGQTSPSVVNAAYASPVQWVWTRAAPNDSFLVSLNGGAAARQGGTSYSLPNPSNQTYILNVVALDSAGNASVAATHSISIDKVAPPAPVVSGTTPTGAPTWNWGAAAGSDGARVYRYKLSTAGAYSVETNSTSYSPVGLATGSYTLQVQERDAAGNWSGDGLHAIEVDRTGPSVSVGRPTPMGRVTNMNPMVSGSVSDDNGIKKVEYRLNASGSYIPILTTSGLWSFKDSLDENLNTIWIRGEDQFGNRDSAQIVIYKYSKVVFVRKNASGTGKSWEDAYGELHQALDSAKTYPIGTNIWVSKGDYGGSSESPNALNIYHSNLNIYGGFYEDRPSTDSLQRDLSLGATKIKTVFFMGVPGIINHDLIFDGFTMANRFIIANGEHYRNTFRNFKFNSISSEGNVILTRGIINFENCEFTSLLSSEDYPIVLKGTMNFTNCKFENNKSGYGKIAISLGIGLVTIKKSRLSGNGGPDGSYHFHLNHDGQRLDISDSEVQNGINGILVDPAFPSSQFIYGPLNREF